MNEHDIISFVLVLTRVSAFVGFFTLFSFRQLPRLIKVGMAVGLSVFWFGEIEMSVAPTTQLGTFDSSLLIAREFAIGLMLSIALNMFFMPCKIAGAYVGQELGLSLAALSNPGTPDSATLVTRVFETFTVLVFFSLNLHHFLLLTIDYSFRHLSGKIDILNLPTEKLVQMLNQTSNYGLTIIAPLAIILMVITASLAILNRAAPAMNLFTIGMSIRSGFGIFCIFMLLPVIFAAIQSYLVQIQWDIEQLLVAFRHG